MKMHSDWKPILGKEVEKEYFQKIKDFINVEKASGRIFYPSSENVFNAFSLSPNNVKVVIIGQDPYHNPNQAHGYSFSVMPGVRPPVSLKNIYKEIETEFGYKMDVNNGNLIPWVNQGVLLLNAILTVQANTPASHRGIGWEIFTDKVIVELSNQYEGIVFMLWGAFARSKVKLIDISKHLILESPHPSGFSAHTGFFGNNHFKLANDYLIESGKAPIDWKI